MAGTGVAFGMTKSKTFSETPTRSIDATGSLDHHTKTQSSIQPTTSPPFLGQLPTLDSNIVSPTLYTPSAAPLSNAPSMSPTIKVWTQLGTTINGSVAGDETGFSVSISEDGKMVAVGARSFSTDENIPNIGKVDIFKYITTSNNGEWKKVGSIIGDAKGDQTGFSLSLSGNGERLAVGIPGHDGVEGKNIGIVRIYEDVQGWVKVHEIPIEEDDALFGASVSLSSDGLRLAVGAPHYNVDGTYRSGGVYTYKNNESGQWVPMTISPLPGDGKEDFFGWSVSLSRDGARLA
eukprot:13216477-Ditylum_brightwellii.AAC.1